MGRFGNQIEQFLGVLAFAKCLNRTLALPPFVNYTLKLFDSKRVTFSDWFDITLMKNYHKIILMEEFMRNIAPQIWTPDNRFGYCYNYKTEGNDCQMKGGNPFGPYWDHFGINFAGSISYNIGYDLIRSDGSVNEQLRVKWLTEFNALSHPVLAFKGAPGPFPVVEHVRPLQKYLVWNDSMLKIAETFMSENGLVRGNYVSIHLRNGKDWENACEIFATNKNTIKGFMASPQCTGFQRKDELTVDMCLPQKSLVLYQTRETMLRNNVRKLFVASDNDHMISELISHLNDFAVDVVKLNNNNPQIDLIILGLSREFIGNCVSTFSSFVKRERDCRNMTSSFWAFNQHTTPNSNDEL